MTYRVSITHEAERQLLAAAVWWSEHRSGEQATRWLDGFENCIARLADDADRCPLAREAPSFAYPIFDLLYGLGARPTHRAVFRIKGDVVEVVAVRHVAQQDLSPDDI